MKPTGSWTILRDGNHYDESVTIDGDRVLVSADTFSRVTGWQLNDAGLCRGERCVPVRNRAAWVHGEAVDLRAATELLEMPLEVDAEDRVAALGESAAERSRALSSLDAPDFTLPDLGGMPRSLSEFRGRKVLLLAFSSW